MGSTSSIGRHLHQHWLDCHIICRIGVSALTSLARIVLPFRCQETNHCLITIVPPGDKSPKLQSSHMQEHPSAATRPTLQGYLSDPSGIDLIAAFIISHHQRRRTGGDASEVTHQRLCNRGDKPEVMHQGKCTRGDVPWEMHQG